jgi:Leucine-rich repeat (LRR) protein
LLTLLLLTFLLFLLRCCVSRSKCLVDVNCLPQLAVLNLSHNRVSRIPSSALACHGTSLKALILNNNELSDVRSVGHLASLNTLILSHNRIESLSPSVFVGLRLLTKLAMCVLAVHE